jgi:hypothetical protein
MPRPHSHRPNSTSYRILRHPSFIAHSPFTLLQQRHRTGITRTSTPIYSSINNYP